MKRRNFLKWLTITPVGIKAFRNKAEELKPEPPGVKEPKPVNTLTRQRLGSDLNATCSSFVFDVFSESWKPGK